MARAHSWIRSRWSLVLVLGLLAAGASACVDQATGESSTEETPAEAARVDLRTRGPSARAKAPYARAMLRTAAPARAQATLRARATLQ
jgi:hypothetical protein